MKKLEISVLEKHEGGDQCGRDIVATIIVDGILGGPVGIFAAIAVNILFNPACSPKGGYTT